MEYRLIGRKVAGEDAKTGESIQLSPVMPRFGNCLEHHSERDRNVLQRGRSVALLDLIVARFQEGVEAAQGQFDAAPQIPAELVRRPGSTIDVRTLGLESRAADQIR